MPSPEVLDKIRKRLRIAADWEYFFRNLDDDTWVEPLMRAGFFKTPPPMKRKDDRIWFPPWPASRYLVRMAPRNPKDVVAAVLSVPETDNESVREDLVQAAALLPPKLAARVAPKVRTWVAGDFYILMPERASAYIKTLAESGNTAALRITGELLAVFGQEERARRSLDGSKPSSTKVVEQGSEEPAIRPRPRPSARMDVWHYSHTIDGLRTTLVEHFGTATLDLFVGLLKRALRLSARDPDAADSESYSYIWRRTIEPDTDYRPSSFVDVLIDTVRDVAAAVVGSDASVLPTVLSSVTDGVVLHRIKLDLLAGIPGLGPDALAEELADPEVVWSFNLRHEAVKLVKNRFAELSKASQKRFLSAIEAGPRRVWAKEPDDAYVEPLQRDWLDLVKEHLPAAWQRRRERLVKRLGPARSIPDPVGGVEVSVGSTSPLSADDLSQMSPASIADYVRDWAPSMEWRSPSREGLARALTESVASRPSEFANQIDEFQGQLPIFVDALLTGFTQRKEARAKLNWSKILAFCEWVESGPRVTGDDLPDEDRQPQTWTYARRDVARLLSSGLEGPAPVSLVHRRRVFSLLRALVDDPDPTPADEGSFSMGPGTLAINSVRGETMHALMRYLMWLHIKYAAKKEPVASAIVEEWKGLVSARLDPAVEPSAAVHSVFGARFPQLVALDEDWARRLRPRIFPRGEKLSYLADAAWESYLLFAGVYWRPYVVLKDQYAIALARLGEHRQDKDLPMADARLAQHIIQFYCSGFLEDRTDRGPVRRLFEGSPHAASHALWLVGRDVAAAPTVWGPDALSRLCRIWDWRLAEYERKPSMDMEIELPGFGWWYPASAFSREYALDRLLRGLRLVPRLEGDHDVLPALARDASAMPALAVEAARLLAGGDRDGWRVQGWTAELQTIIRAGLADPESAQAADELANYLAARGEVGYEQFGR